MLPASSHGSRLKPAGVLGLVAAFHQLKLVANKYRLKPTVPGPNEPEGGEKESLRAA